MDAADSLVSVVIPTRNRAGLVGRAVASVLAQTHANLELVVVDDASDDDTAARLAAVADPRLRLLVLDRPGGVSAARNRGLAVCRGDYLALLDSDDAWLPPKIERQLAFLRQRGLAICQTQEIWMRGGRRVNPGQGQTKIDGLFFPQALERCLVSPSTVLFTRAYWQALGPFDEGLATCEDYDLWLRTLAGGLPIGLLDVPLAVRHGGRADQLSASCLGQDLFRIRAMLGLLGQDGLSDWHRDCIEKELARKVAIYVRGCLANGLAEEAVRVRELARAGVAAAHGDGRDAAGSTGSRG